MASPKPYSVNLKHSNLIMTPQMDEPINLLYTITDMDDTPVFNVTMKHAFLFFGTKYHIEHVTGGSIGIAWPHRTFPKLSWKYQFYGNEFTITEQADIEPQFSTLSSNGLSNEVKVVYQYDHYVYDLLSEQENRLATIHLDNHKQHHRYILENINPRFTLFSIAAAIFIGQENWQIPRRSGIHHINP